MLKRDKERTKQKIVNSAICEFMKKGFLEASTLDIARNADVAHSTIFFYFPTKAELIISSIYSKLQKLGDKLDEESRTTTNVRKLCKIFLNEVRRNEKFYSRLVKELPLMPISTQRVVFASLSGFSVHFVDVIYKGQRAGKFRRFKPRIAIFFWFGMINYLYSYSKLLGTRKLKKKDLDEIIRFFTKSLKR